LHGVAWCCIADIFMRPYNFKVWMRVWRVWGVKIQVAVALGSGPPPHPSQAAHKCTPVPACSLYPHACCEPHGRCGPSPRPRCSAAGCANLLLTPPNRAPLDPSNFPPSAPCRCGPSPRPRCSAAGWASASRQSTSTARSQTSSTTRLVRAPWCRSGGQRHQQQG
jgi:hypothetical protein